MRKKAAHFATELMYTINSTTPAAIPLKRIEEGYEGCYDTFKQFFKLGKCQLAGKHKYFATSN